MPELLHATAIAVAARAVMIRGASGAGKSDLALRCLALTRTPFADEPVHLVADDQIVAEAVNGVVRLQCPPAIAGQIEVRGVGIVHVPFVVEARLALVIDLVATGTPERLPDPAASVIVCGLEIPCIQLAPFEPSAPIKMLLSLAKHGIG